MSLVTSTFRWLDDVASAQESLRQGVALWAAPVLLFDVAFVVVAAWLGRDDLIAVFVEEGAVTWMSATFLWIASLLAATCLVLAAGAWGQSRTRQLLWGFLALGLAFLALDERLEFHERGGHLLASVVGEPLGVFRNWNDVLVIGYGVAALVFLALFGRELLRVPRVAGLLVASFVFYSLHTLVDSVSNYYVTIPVEESFKLACSSLLATAMLAGVVTTPGRRGPSDPTR